MNTACDTVSSKAKLPAGYTNLHEVFANRTQPHNIIRHAAHAGLFREAIYVKAEDSRVGHLYVDAAAAAAYVEKKQAERLSRAQPPVNGHRASSERELFQTAPEDRTLKELRRIGDLLQQLLDVTRGQQVGARGEILPEAFTSSEEARPS